MERGSVTDRNVETHMCDKRILMVFGIALAQDFDADIVAQSDQQV